MSDIYLSLTETPTVVTLSQPVVSGVLSSNVTVTNVVSVNVVTMPAITVQAAAPAVTTVAGTVAVSNFPASSSVTIGGFSTSILPPSTVTVGNSVTIGNFPATQTISGAVTANVEAGSGSFFGDGNSDLSMTLANSILSVNLKDPDNGQNPIGVAANPLPISGTVTANVTNSVTIGSLPAISGTVTANGGNFINADNALITKDSASNIVLVGGLLYSATPTQSAINAIRTDGNGAVVVYSGQTRWTDANAGDQPRSTSQLYPFPVQVLGGSVTIGSLPTLAPQFPRVTFIDGSGTVTTSNTAITVFASSSTRSYLLVQVTTGSAFVNVGATATTVNGINLTAGQGYAWETTIPQGIVSLISTTTSSRWVAKEA